MARALDGYRPPLLRIRHPLDVHDVHASPSNFIIFGEMGVGKSSLINLIAGKQVAVTSSGAMSCTFASTTYQIRFPASYFRPDFEYDVNLYDTAGLNEPTMNSATYLDAVAGAHKLLISLEEKGCGIHGLLFCIRGSRISDTVQRNYRLFYELLCQKKVPLALIITGLENEEGDMDNFWTRNQAHVEKSGIASVAHACITTIKGYNNVYEKRYLESRKKVHRMIDELLACEVSCPVDTTGLFVPVCKGLRELLAPGKVPGKSRAKMMQVLTKRCKLSKEDAMQLLRRIEEKV